MPATSLHATQMINPFLISRISANHDKVKGYSANCNVKILIKGCEIYLCKHGYNIFLDLFFKKINF